MKIYYFIKNKTSSYKFNKKEFSNKTLHPNYKNSFYW